ncbi:MAG: NAD(P)H-hydrate dehydratase [Opitutaceae bacterium]
MTPLPSHPILSPAQTRVLEERLFGGDESRAWSAMRTAGRALARAIRLDGAELGGLDPAGRWLVVAGKGHNGGDALLAAGFLREVNPAARIEVCFPFGSRRLRPLAARAWRELVARVPQVAVVDGPEGSFDLLVVGLFGFQFRPPVDPAVLRLIDRLNALPVRLRAAVDLPSAGLVRADFTYATGVLKTPLLSSPEAGRLRYLDLGFFADETPPEALPAEGLDPGRVLLPEVLRPLAALRPSASDKRSYGHLFVLAGSASFPGAALLAVLAALRSGVGLVTAFVPERLVPAFAARAPEAMWVGWPETPSGHLALEGEYLWREREERASAILLGPGLGREAETLALAESIAARAVVPLVLDADALQPAIIGSGPVPRILTPHAGELARIGGRGRMPPGAVLVEKGPLTRIVAEGRVHHALCGGPVLARGGSGDLLAGLIGGILAQDPPEPRWAAACGVLWHGRAADGLARARGQTAVTVSQLLDFLPDALREFQG